jgi:hypothetical protein
MTPHDFEFQLGRNRALRGRGWRGLLALGFLLMTCVMITTGSSWITSSIRSGIEYLGRQILTHTDALGGRVGDLNLPRVARRPKIEDQAN